MLCHRLIQNDSEMTQRVEEVNYEQFDGEQGQEPLMGLPIQW